MLHSSQLIGHVLCRADSEPVTRPCYAGFDNDDDDDDDEDDNVRNDYDGSEMKVFARHTAL